MTTYPASLPRVLSLLVLSGLCFQTGRWVEQLTARAESETPDAVVAVRAAARAAQHPETAAAPAPSAPVSGEPAEPVPGTTSGAPMGDNDIITPLNVRDPTSLVMGPGSSGSCPPRALAPGEPHAVPVPPGARPHDAPLPYPVPRGGFVAPDNY